MLANIFFHYGFRFTISSRPNSSLESFIHLLLADGKPISTTTSPSFNNSFCDAYWDHQDVSQPSPASTKEVSIEETHSVCGQIFFLGGSPILYKTHKEAQISRSFCEAEGKATDKCIKNVQVFRHSRIYSYLTPQYQPMFKMIILLLPTSRTPLALYVCII